MAMQESNGFAEIIEEQAGEEYGMLFRAFMDKYLTKEELDNVCLEQIERQRQRGDLRDNRHIPHIETTRCEKDRIGRQAAIDQNHADREWINKLELYKKEHGEFDLSEKEQDWVVYLMRKVIQGATAEYMKRRSDLDLIGYTPKRAPEREPQAQLDAMSVKDDDLAF